MNPPSERRLGAYVIGEPLASTASGEWFAASEAGLERRVSLLLAPLPDDEGEADAMRERARRLAGTDDPRLLPVYGQGEDDRLLWMATRQVVGRSIADLDPLEPARAAKVGADIARQLAALQDAGLAPDDVQAESVIVEGTGKQERAWLLPSPDRPAGEDASGATHGLLALLETSGRPLVDSPSLDPATLADQLAPLYAERRGRRNTLVAVVGLVLLGAIAALLAVFLTRDSGSAGPDSPIASTIARIPLGSSVSALTADEANVWAATPNGELIHIDIERESVVGTPAKLLPSDAYVDVVSDGSTVWAGGPGVLLRLDSTTGRVVERKRMSTRAVVGLLVRDGSAWASVTEGESPFATVVRVEDGIDREETVGPAGVFGIPVFASGEQVWAVGGDASFVRLAPGSEPTIIAGGLQAGFPTEHDERVWLPTRADQTLLEIDPARMTIERTLHFEAQPYRAAAGGDAIWVLTQNPSQIHRIDPAAGRFVGPPLAAPNGATFIRFGGGSLWVDDPNTKELVRLAPSSPAPGERLVDATPGVLRNGPVPTNVRLRVESLEPLFSIELPDEGWLAGGVTGEGAQFELMRHRRFGLDYVGVSFAVVAQAFGAKGRLVPIRTPNDFVRSLRQNRSIRIERVVPATVEGRNGVKVRFATDPKPPFPEFCRGAPCVPLFPQGRATFVLLKGTEEFTMVKHGRGVFLVDATFSDRTDPEIGRKIDRLIESIRFER